VHGVLGQIDPTLVPDGAYYLDLHADGTGGDDGAEITVNVRGKLKLGDFKIAFTDLTVPVAGIPITVRRSYDSLQANNSRDLGYGWKLDFGDADLKVDFRNNPFRAQGQYPAFTTGELIVVSREGADPEGLLFHADSCVTLSSAGCLLPRLPTRPRRHQSVGRPTGRAYPRAARTNQSSGF
jgi:hypothetical protein